VHEKRKVIGDGEWAEGRGLSIFRNTVGQLYFFAKTEEEGGKPNPIEGVAFWGG